MCNDPRLWVLGLSAGDRLGVVTSWRIAHTPQFQAMMPGGNDPASSDLIFQQKPKRQIFM